ncbi:hypothetical protein [Streptomyces sp. NPDC046261]|uniref:hypothetical protein n=1 Tax=Streptomyces sp. NPDC046261 TaxID=3157200 RepID=UPI00340BFFED
MTAPTPAGNATQPRPPWHPRAWQGCLLAAGTCVPLAAGSAWYACRGLGVEVIRLQLAGSADEAAEVVGDRVPAFQRALHADYVFLAGYTLTLIAVFALAHRTIARRLSHRRAAVTAMVLAGSAGACDVAENLFLAHGLRHFTPGADLPFTVATACAALKWLLLGLTVPTAAVVLVIILKRALIHTAAALPGLRWLSPARPPAQDFAAGPELIPPWPVARADGERWPRAGRTPPPAPGSGTRWRNGNLVPPGREQGALGFCVSGGGIRSACVTLGALQALRDHLRKARYLVSVSGGGYMAGALQLALNGAADDKAPAASRPGPADVFEPGSPEEDHLRRHSKYIAEGTGQWLAALGVLLRGLLASLGLLIAMLLVLGLALSWAYHLVPLTDVDHLSASGVLFPSDCPPPPAPVFREPVLWTVLGLLGVAAACWIVWLVLFTWCGALVRAPKWALTVFRACVVLALLLTVAAVVLPGVAWGTVRLRAGLELSAPQAGAGVGFTALFTYGAVLIATLWRRRQTVRQGFGRALGTTRRTGKLTRAVPNGFTQYVIVWLVLLLLTVVSLLVLGWATATGRRWGLVWQIGLPAALALIVLCLDQTWMSLHPFYRLRLASAFAVRRCTEPDGEVVARPYDFATEPTPLHRYGRRHPGFPQVIFAAAANLSGSDRTPPGRHAVSFTLSHDYVGGPDVGYARVDSLEQRTGRLIRRDLTVQSAMAVSGAAFASAMGTQSRTFQTLFALSNARLGTWLPNPAALGPLWEAGSDWRLPPQPAIRRLSYLLREITGRYPMDDRLLLTTDGGHYENLGLVELLRHGVTTAVCVDASGYTPPFAATLAQAITLAHEELGIEITLHDTEKLVPGSARPLQPESPLATINARLAAQAVITGDIVYPRDLIGADGRNLGRRGQLVVARATLTRGMPYKLLAYASSHPVFPHDSTSDQWFDHQQFDAYKELGHYIGEQAAAVLRLLPRRDH